MKDRLRCFLLMMLIGILPTIVHAAPDSLITVLNVSDPAPAGQSQIARQIFTGNDPLKACAYYELVESAKRTALNLGANVVKVNKHKERSRQQHCDELDISFYAVDDVHTIERHISWTAGRSLVWEDFKGVIPPDASATNVAVSSVGIGIQTNTVITGGQVKVYVFNSFETERSWVRETDHRHAVLVHEQGHFDICELYTRRMRQRFAAANITFDNLQSVNRDVYNQTMKEYRQRQADYEDATQHGMIEVAQQEWTAQIARELAELDNRVSN